jgi:hypothetical protein
LISARAGFKNYAREATITKYLSTIMQLKNHKKSGLSPTIHCHWIIVTGVNSAKNSMKQKSLEIDMDEDQEKLQENSAIT